MKYKVFVASTYADLVRKRAYVIDKLRKAGLDVVCMEDFAADGEHPAKLSVNQVRGCDFCVALVGFQIGTTSTAHSGNRSITQLEVETAESSQVQVLPFILRDTPENRQEWPKEFTHLDDAEVEKWRARLASNKTAEFFDAAEWPDVLPAIVRIITRRESIKRKRLTLGLAALTITLAGVVVLPFESQGARDVILSALLRRNDPIAFREPSKGEIKVARLLENRSEIQGADFGADILAANRSFVVFANTLGSFRQFQKQYETIASRGVRLRFIVTDFSEENRTNWETFTNAIEDSPKRHEETQANASNIRKMISDLRSKYPKNVEYRLSRKPIFYTLWVRDIDNDDALGHISLHYYGRISQVNWPAYRVSKRTGGKQIYALADQFEALWSEAIPDSEH